MIDVLHGIKTFSRALNYPDVGCQNVRWIESRRLIPRQSAPRKILGCHSNPDGAFSRALFQSLAVAVVFIAAGTPIAAFAVEKTSIVGRWLAPDGDSGRPRAIIDIARNGNEIVGTIAEIYTAPDVDPDPVCEQCVGADHNRRIRGLAILFVRPSTAIEEYRGTILDPEEGRIYRCVLTANATGDRLAIRGYVGIPLLGRTETWTRTR